MADPLDVFARDAVAAALGYPVRVAVAVPIELEAAFDRLYATSDEDGGEAALLDEVIPDAEPAEEDAERLKDLASEAPVIRLVNQLIARAVETHASDVHLEPFPDRLRVRYRYEGTVFRSMRIRRHCTMWARSAVSAWARRKTSSWISSLGAMWP